LFVPQPTAHVSKLATNHKMAFTLIQSFTSSLTHLIFLPCCGSNGAELESRVKRSASITSNRVVYGQYERRLFLKPIMAPTTRRQSRLLGEDGGSFGIGEGGGHGGESIDDGRVGLLLPPLKLTPFLTGVGGGGEEERGGVGDKSKAEEGTMNNVENEEITIRKLKEGKKEEEDAAPGERIKEKAIAVDETNIDGVPDVQMSGTAIPVAKVGSLIDETVEEVDVEDMASLEVKSLSLQDEQEIEQEIIEALHRSDGEDEGM
jgi:hypothetical protein